MSCPFFNINAMPSNPTIVNSATIEQFGFKATFDVVEETLTLDITGLTTFLGSGNTNNQGVCFEIIDPSGSYLAEIDFTAIAIDTDVLQTYTVNLSSVSKYGFYAIKGQIKDVSGVITTIELDPIEICSTGNTDKDGYIVSRLSHMMNCVNNKLTFLMNTTISYKNKTIVSKTHDYSLIYPDSETSPINEISSIPVSITAPTTGTYIFKGKTTAKFDLENNIYLIIGYAARYEASVSCQGQLETIYCCIAELSEEAQNCDTAKGKDAERKLKEIFPLFMMATIKDRQGLDASDIIKDIKKIGNCDCKCDEVRALSTVPLQNANGQIFVFEGACGADVTQEVNGETVTVTISTPIYNIVKGASSLISITPSTSECTKTWTINIDDAGLYAFVKETLIADSEFATWLIEFIKQNQPKPNVNMKCLGDGSEKDYHAELCANATSGLSLTWKRIKINGVWYNAPASLDTSEVADATTWLNSLSLGTFAVTAKLGCACASYFSDGTGYQISVDSDNNENIVQTIEITANDDSQLYEIPVDSTAAVNSLLTLDEIIQLIVDWICEFCLCGQKLCQAFDVATLSCFEIATFACNCEIILSNGDTTVASNGYKYGGDINPNFEITDDGVVVSVIPEDLGWKFNGTEFQMIYPCGAYAIAVNDKTSALCPALIFSITVINDTSLTVVMTNLAAGDTYEYSIDDGLTWFYNASAATFTIVGLSPATTYRIKLRRSCSNGSTATSSTIVATTTALPCNIPTFDITNVTGTSFVVNITNCQAGTPYDISVDGGANYIVSGVIGCAIQVNGLTASTEYSVVVRHKCDGAPVSAATEVVTTVMNYCVWLTYAWASGGNGSTTGEFTVTATLKDGNGNVVAATLDTDYSFVTYYGGSVTQVYGGTIAAGSTFDTTHVMFTNSGETIGYNSCEYVGCGSESSPCICGVPAAPCNNCLVLTPTPETNEVVITLTDCCGNAVLSPSDIDIVFTVDCDEEDQKSGTIAGGTSSVTVNVGCTAAVATLVSTNRGLVQCPYE